LMAMGPWMNKKLARCKLYSHVSQTYIEESLY
jgi:hypothetical protein